ncbi:T9SS type B sorting domain-containing protein [Flavobacteriaceae bacterium SZ-1-7]|uniref:T9SS type B sorting domain-containing protein n=1 Tax=Tamlana sedimenti TaxID=3134126 RepID=UPI0031262649
MSFTDDFHNTSTGEFWYNGDIYVRKNWNNDGIVDFSIFDRNEGHIHFNGEKEQIILGFSLSHFFDVTFNNPTVKSAFNLFGDISIYNEAVFTSGVIENRLSGGTVIFEQNADSFGANNHSHVNGPVIKDGFELFEFPIGNGTFHRMAGISSPTIIDNMFIGEYFFEETNINYPVNNLGPNLNIIDKTEHWSIESSNNANQVYITLTWNEQTTPQEIFNGSIESIHIARWDNSLKKWIDQGGIQNPQNQSVSALVENLGVVTLAKVNETKEIDFPKFFTPNGDGYNDTWNIKKPNNIEILSIQIFDRFGKLLKQIGSGEVGWNGKFNGKQLPNSDYWFLVNYKTLEDNVLRKFKSHFTLKL